ncbi:MAG: hypothetical protein LBR07_02170 [Puniceicoccales bacterium]|nr:hypothetical protein [Puniceicoccales bacterium]
MNTSNIASEESTAIGNSALAYGANSIAIGNFVSVYADETITIGNYSYSTAYGSVLIGHNLQTSGDNSPQVIFGRNNEPVAGGVFSIGNGTGAWLFDEQAGYYTQDRSNLLLIMEDGRTILRHRDYPAPTGTGANDSATPPALPTPQKEALRVQGNATVDGIFRVRPAGDIGMGPFTEDDGL